jgi:hypothetical protein
MAMIPMKRDSMSQGWGLEFLTADHVESAEKDKGDGDSEIDEVCHAENRVSIPSSARINEW